MKSAFLQSLWQGEARPARWFLRLLGGLAIATLASLAWRAAALLAHWPPPMKTVSIVLVIVAFGLAVWSGWLLWRVLRQSGVRRMLILLAVLYLSVVMIRVLTLEKERPLAQRILPEMQGVASGAWRALVSLVRSIVEAPSTFRFAYAGRNPLVRIPGAEVNLTPIEGKIIEPLVFTSLDQLTPTSMPALVPTSAPREVEGGGGIRIGSRVQVTGTGGKALRARSGPGTSYDIVARFDEGVQLLILEGPVEADGYTWWKVRRDQEEGWCAGQWLAPIE